MEHAILHETIDGQRVDFYPETGFDDVMETDGEDAVTLRMVLQGLRTNISDEAQIRETADTALQSAITAEVQARTKAVSDEATARQTADAALQTNIDTKAAKATTLAGYGISNAYTKTETDNLLNSKANTSSTYTKNEVNASLENKADKTNTYTKSEVSALLNTKINKLQTPDDEGKILQVSPTGELILVDMPQTGGGIDVGVIVPYASNGDIPVGFLLCNGASVGVETYPALFEVIGYTYGGSEDYFNLPNLVGRFAEGGENAGQYKEAGLPNIEGDTWIRPYGDAMAENGAFYLIASKSRNPSTGAYSSAVSSTTTVGFDASRSNSIYGNSDTVQPKSLVVRYIIKAFAGASASSTDLQITNVANDVVALSGRVDNIASELGAMVVDSGRSSDGTIWYRKWSDGWLEQGGYIAHPSSTTTVTVNLPARFVNTDYQIIMSYAGSGTTSVTAREMAGYEKGVNSFKTYASSSSDKNWYACGQGGND